MINYLHSSHPFVVLTVFLWQLALFTQSVASDKQQTATYDQPLSLPAYPALHCGLVFFARNSANLRTSPSSGSDSLLRAALSFVRLSITHPSFVVLTGFLWCDLTWPPVFSPAARVSAALHHSDIVSPFLLARSLIRALTSSGTRTPMTVVLRPLTIVLTTLPHSVNTCQARCCSIQPGVKAPRI